MDFDDQMERLNYKINFTIGMVVGCVIVSAFFATRLSRLPKESLAAFHTKVITGELTSAAIATQELRLTDDEGQTMALLSVDEEAGAGQLVLSNAAGNRLFEFSGSDGGAMLTMSDSEDRIGAIVSVDEEGRGNLILLNSNEECSVALLTYEELGGGICTADANGNYVTAISAGPGGSGEVKLSDGNGTMRPVSQLFGRDSSPSATVATGEPPQQ